MAAFRLRLRSRLFADRAGSVGLEMALVTPLIMLLLLGFFEAYMYIRTVGLVERAAASVANTMARQRGSLNDCAAATDALNLGTYMEAAVQVADPVNLAVGGEVIVSAVDWPNNVPAPRVAWQRRSLYADTKYASALGTQGQQASLPNGLAAVVERGNDTLLVAEVFYRFTPFAMTAPFWPGAPGAVTVTRSAYFRARTANLGALTPCVPPLPTPPA